MTADSKKKKKACFRSFQKLKTDRNIRMIPVTQREGQSAAVQTNNTFSFKNYLNASAIWIALKTWSSNDEKKEGFYFDGHSLFVGFFSVFPSLSFWVLLHYRICQLIFKINYGLIYFTVNKVHTRANTFFFPGNMILCL